MLDRLFRLALLQLILFGISCARVDAMVALKRDFADLVARSEQIVVGTVVKVEVGESADGSPRTFVTLADLSVLKGSVGKELTLQFYGGQQGETSTSISDMPQFSEGDRVVLFVAGNGRAVCPLVGLWQGRFRVRFDAERNADVIDADDGRVVVGRSQRDLHFARTGDASAKPVTVDEFRQMVTDELAHPSRPEATQP
ncbi:MAG: hypothetical protein HY270_07540 [Deltaproteobacteria bacterium]|nr:hypothetical protein [Deltaproteobacteria bacterium]